LAAPDVVEGAAISVGVANKPRHQYVCSAATKVERKPVEPESEEDEAGFDVELPLLDKLDFDELGYIREGVVRAIIWVMLGGELTEAAGDFVPAELGPSLVAVPASPFGMTHNATSSIPHPAMPHTM
jgi:hypothetical protein